MAQELIGGAIFTLLYDGVKKALVETSTFKCLLKDLKFTLESLTRLRATAIQQIGVYNVELGLPNEEIEDLERRMEEGAKLVEKLSNSSLWKWNYCSISFYSDQIVDLDRALRRLLENLKLQEARDVKELLELSRKAERNTHKDLNEVKRMLLNIEKLLQQKEEGVMETSASGRNTETMTEPNEGNGGEQGTSENDNRNRVSNTSSSTEISIVLEAASTRMDKSQTDGEILEKTNLRVFSFAELKVTTRNFRPDAVLGEGGFGRVFKGWVDKKTFAPSKPGNGMAVAIKRLDTNSLQGILEWQSEVNFLGKLSHSNIVKLLGYCWEKTELLLVYELMPRGSLDNHLFRRSAAIKTLSWDKRLKIAVGAARGLAFLHTLEVPVILRDFKPSNILLDGKYNAKICDFGLAKLGPTGGDSHVSTVIAGTEFIATGLAKLGPTDGKSHVSTRVMGTYGYAAPEYVATGCLYVKSDVYGFGVVLLEILTGLRVIDANRRREKINLVEWAKPLLLHKRKLKTIMDVRIEGQYSFEAALQTAHLTLKCLQPEPKNRPSMEEVLDALEQIRAIKERPEAIQTYL